MHRLRPLAPLWIFLALAGASDAARAQDPAASRDAIKSANAVILASVGAQDVVGLLREVGIDPEVRTDPGGDPLVRGVHLGAPFLVLFYDCGSSGPSCGAIQFRGYVPRAEDLSPDAMQRWNRTRRLGRAYFDGDGDPTIEWYVRLDGGVTPEHLRSQRDWFLKAYEAFREEFLR